jgi:DNA-binding NtrC family response regulator
MSAVNVPQGETANARNRVLVVDDEAGMRTALEVNFRRRGWQVETAFGKADALARFRQRKHALVVTDIRMPDGSGFEVMHEVQEMTPATAVILLTAFASVPDAVSAMKTGACEYLVKPVAFERLLEAAERVLRRDVQDGDAQVRDARDGDVRNGDFRNKDSGNWKMVGSSPALMRALGRARQAAHSDADVLIQAESGTGKELLARMIHSLSPRHDGPFVAINCAGIPESLLENELFGHGRGAFTGAVTAQPGKFELANRGTLLLDEIGEMPLSLQPKLLRALQEREFYRLGETRPVKVNIRVLVTTNRDLESMVRDSSFRADLNYRLNVIPLTLPPLRERCADVRELALHFAKLFSSPGADPPEFAEGLLLQLERHSWPGNVRELANLIRRTIALQSGRNRLEALENTFPEFTTNEFAENVASSPQVESSAELPAEPRALAAMQPGMSLENMQRRLLAITLDATRGNRSRAAEMLGVSLRTVRNKIREYHLPPRREYARLHD